MRIFGRVLGWLLILAAVAVLGADALVALESGQFGPRPAGQLWFQLDAGSLNLVQAVVQRYLHPSIWDPGITAILLLPAFVVLAVPGVLLALLCRPRPDRRKPLFY
jgi:hypothetical protein